MFGCFIHAPETSSGIVSPERNSGKMKGRMSFSRGGSKKKTKTWVSREKGISACASFRVEPLRKTSEGGGRSEKGLVNRGVEFQANFAKSSRERVLFHLLKKLGLKTCLKVSEKGEGRGKSQLEEPFKIPGGGKKKRQTGRKGFGRGYEIGERKASLKAREWSFRWEAITAKKRRR